MTSSKLVAAFAFIFVASTCAAAYPERPIRLVVPVAPGGAVDVVGRFTGQKLAGVLGQNVVIDNRAGANYIIAPDCGDARHARALHRAQSRPVGSSPKAFAQFLKNDIEKYAEIARKAGIQPQ